MSQFVQPYTDQEVATILKTRAENGDMVQDWELEAYKFKPLNPDQLSALIDDNKALTKYLRATCVRLVSSTQTEKSIKRGDLLDLNLSLFAGAVDEAEIDKYQKRIIAPEQGISIKEAKDYGFMICNPDTEEIKYSEQLEALSLKDGVKYYLDFYNKLPKINSVEDLPKLAEVSFVKDSDGKIIGEFGQNEVSANRQVIRRNRRLMPTEPIPTLIKKALVSIEDSRFWNFEPKGSEAYQGHLGVDFKGLMRAMISSGEGDLQGGSTISMQLVKNLLLYKDVFKEHNQGKRSVLRKLKEYILVRRIEQVLTKDQILDWYLNTIDFGRNSQGVVMAARSYFGKDLKDITLTDAAFLASLPKAPNDLDPEENFEKALKRRNKVISSMKKSKHISSTEKKAARAETINFIPKTASTAEQGYASFYVSAVEKQMKDWFGAVGAQNTSSSQIVTPINHQYQKWAVESLQRGLLNIERAKGSLVVKPDEDQLPNLKNKIEALAAERGVEDLELVYPEVFAKVKNQYPDGGQFKLGLVLSTSKFALQDGTVVLRSSKDKKRKKRVEGKKRHLEKWDVVLLQPIVSKGKTTYRVASFTDVQGAIVVLDNKTGAVLATSGGFSIGAGRRYQGSEGNRAFSSARQPGSTVKPFSYFSAMMKGLSPATVVSNQDIALPQRKIDGDELCVPWEFSAKKSESSAYTLRSGLEQSKNSLTLNAFASSLGLRPGEFYSDFPEILGAGIDSVLRIMQKFGLYQNLKHACYPILLGTNEVKPVDLAGAYAAIRNQGVYKVPHVLSSVTKNGLTTNPFEQSQLVTNLLQTELSADTDEKFNLFRVRTFMQGVVKNGTARRIKKWHKVIAGKTGTTNDNRDAWFAGFNKEITVVVWVGYPKKRFLGSKFDGSKAALPIFKDFMTQYFEAHPEKLKDEFPSKPTSGVTAVVAPGTGYYISPNFQSDYEYYTGRTSAIPSAKEHFRDSIELNENTGPYVVGSLTAGRFFFKHLGKEYKAYYKNEFEVKAQQVKDSLGVFKQNYQAQKDYCRANKKKFPDHEYVINACAEEVRLKAYIEDTEDSIGSLEKYYLQTLGFK